MIELGLTGFLMMIYLFDVTDGKWYQFLSFFATSALIFVAFSPDYRQMLDKIPEDVRTEVEKLEDVFSWIIFA